MRAFGAYQARRMLPVFAVFNSPFGIPYFEIRDIYLSSSVQALYFDVQIPVELSNAYGHDRINRVTGQLVE